MIYIIIIIQWVNLISKHKLFDCSVGHTMPGNEFMLLTCSRDLFCNNTAQNSASK